MDKKEHYQHFDIMNSWGRRIEIASDILKGGLDQAYFFEVLLKKRPEIKGILINADQGQAIIDFNAEKLEQHDLLTIIDRILGNLKQKNQANRQPAGKNGSQNEIREIRLLVDGMSCPACAALIKVALKKMPGVEDAYAELDSKEVIVYGSLTEQRLIEKIEELGYKQIKTEKKYHEA
jgi:Cu+-exporting ATPase